VKPVRTMSAAARARATNAAPTCHDLRVTNLALSPRSFQSASLKGTSVIPSSAASCPGSVCTAPLKGSRVRSADTWRRRKHERRVAVAKVETPIALLL
jgi:hypothetical protein